MNMIYERPSLLSLIDTFVAPSGQLQWRIINASMLARDVGVDFKTVQRYLDVMEGAYLLRIIPPFFANVSKRVRKTQWMT